MVDNFVRLGMAMTVIMLITFCLYAANGRQAIAVEPNYSGIGVRR